MMRKIITDGFIQQQDSKHLKWLRISHSWFPSPIQRPSVSCCSGCYLSSNCLCMPALPHHPLISLLIPHHKGGGGCHIYRGLSPSPKHTHTIWSCISTFFLSWIVLFFYYCLSYRTNATYFNWFRDVQFRPADVSRPTIIHLIYLTDQKMHWHVRMFVVTR